MECSTDGGSTWVPFLQDTEYTLDSGKKMYIRAGANGNATLSSSASYYNNFAITGDISASGDVNSLLSRNYWEVDSVPDYAYYRLFYGCAALSDITGLILRAKSVNSHSYAYMFYWCTSITTAPDLPATALLSYAYSHMFYGCSSLKAAPDLPATKLAPYCYEYMFYTCGALTSVPDMHATSTATYAYYNMFNGCTSLVKGPTFETVLGTEGMFNSMFANCTKLEYVNGGVSAYSRYACAYMFDGCTSLTNAPTIGNGFESHSGIAMFRNCKSLKKSPKCTTTSMWVWENGCQYMFQGCTSLEDAELLENITYVRSYGCQSMYSGCTSLRSAKVGPPNSDSVSHMDYSFGYLFNGCSNLKEIYVGKWGDWSSTSYKDVWTSWVSGVSSSGTFHYSGTDTARGVSAIPTGWTVVPYVNLSQD